MATEMHPEYLCPCGAAHGTMTDHPASERLCAEHASGTGFRGVPPVYAKGKEAPQEFENFQAEQAKQAEAAPEPSKSQPRKKK